MNFNFTDEIIDYFENNINRLFKNKRDIDVAYAIVELMKRRDDIENFNKKALYILIREMSNVNTSHITAVVNVFKKHYKTILNDFYKCGDVSNKKNNSFF